MKAMLVSMLAFVLSVVSCSDDGVAIGFERLPEASQSFLNKYFLGLTPLVIRADGNEYEVVFTNGASVEFDRKGNWKDVNCTYRSVPADIVPSEILVTINELYPGALIVKIERDRRGYDVRLNVGVELEFNKKFMLTEADFND